MYVPTHLEITLCFRMPPKLITIRKKGTTTADQMRRAVHAHLQDGLSIRKAAKEFEVAYPTLRRYVKKFIQDRSAKMEPNYDVNRIFTVEQEADVK